MTQKDLLRLCKKCGWPSEMQELPQTGPMDLLDLAKLIERRAYEKVINSVKELK